MENHMLENNWSASDAPQRKQENFQPQFSDYVSATGGCRTRSQTANDSQTLVNNGVLPVLDFTSEDSSVRTASSGGYGADNAESSCSEKMHHGSSRDNDRWDNDKGDCSTAPAGSDTGAGSTPAPVGSDTGADSTTTPVGSDTGAGSTPAPVGSDTGAVSTPVPVGTPIDANGATVVYNNGTGAWLNQDFDYNAITNYNATPTSPPPDGASHVATTTLTGPAGGFQPYAPGFSQPITGDHYLNFSLNTNGQALSNFNVYAMKVGDIATGTGVYGNLAQNETSSNSNGWNTFSVPIDSALGLQGENSMYKFAIQDSGGTTGDSFQVSGITLSPDQKTA